MSTQRALPASWLATRLAIGPERLELARRGGEMIGVRPAGAWEHHYPSWQFGPDGRPRPFIRRLVAAAREAGLGDERLVELLEARAGLTGGRRLVELIEAGEEERVLAVVRAQAARPG